MAMGSRIWIFLACLSFSEALFRARPALARACRVSCIAMEPPRTAPTIEGETVGDRTISGQTYREQFEEVFSQELRTSRPLPKPRPAVASDPGARHIPFSNVRRHSCCSSRATDLLAPPRLGPRLGAAGVGPAHALAVFQGPDVAVYGHRTCAAAALGARSSSQPSLGSRAAPTTAAGLIFFAFNHGVGIFAPLLFFSWKRMGLHFLLYCASGMGITYSYHRQLAHRSFKSKKWLEYLACFCGMIAMQGGPIEWVSDHRYHHLHTETALDPHSSYEGFYWSHLGWMLDAEVYEARERRQKRLGPPGLLEGSCHEYQGQWASGLSTEPVRAARAPQKAHRHPLSCPPAGALLGPLQHRRPPAAALLPLVPAVLHAVHLLALRADVGHRRAARALLALLRHRVFVPRHVVCQLGVALLGEAGLRDGRPVAQQLVGGLARLWRGLAQQPPRL